MNDLLFIQALLGYWGETAHRGLLPLSPKRICDDISALGGITVLVYARWYPAELLLYAGGIAAGAAQRYENLRDLMLVPVKYLLGDLGEEPILLSAAVQAMLQLDRLQAFESLPGLSKHYTPRSDYLHGFLAPILEEALFIGSDYEDAFDRFEALYALEHDHRTRKLFQLWGPPGRFAWKLGVLDKLIKEAEVEGPSWGRFVLDCLVDPRSDSILWPRSIRKWYVRVVGVDEPTLSSPRLSRLSWG